MKILSLFLSCVCILGCASYGEDDEIQGMFPTDPVVEQTTDTTTEQPQQQTVECPPEFQGELVIGKLDDSGSKWYSISINADIIYYYEVLNLILDNGSHINIVLESPARYAIYLRNKRNKNFIVDEDLLLVRLNHLVEPGTWKGVLIKNLTRNITFEED